MTQPPHGPPDPGRPDQGPPDYGQQGPPPGYGYGQPYPPQPSPYHQQPGMAGWSKVLIGAVLGMVGGVIVLVAVLLIIGFTADSWSGDGGGITGEAVFALCVLVPTLLPAPMLLFRATRLWAVGLMIGAAMSTVVLAGTCAYIITGLEGSA